MGGIQSPSSAASYSRTSLRLSGKRGVTGPLRAGISLRIPGSSSRRSPSPPEGHRFGLLAESSEQYAALRGSGTASSQDGLTQGSPQEAYDQLSPAVGMRTSQSSFGWWMTSSRRSVAPETTSPSARSLPSPGQTETPGSVPRRASSITSRRRIRHVGIAWTGGPPRGGSTQRQ